MMKQLLTWHHVKNTDELAQKAATMILVHAEQAIKKQDAFKLVLAGGGTPENAYRLLIQAQTDWRKWHIYYGDERCLPANHQDRNSKMAMEVFLRHTQIPSHQIHPIATELGVEQAKVAYQGLIETCLPFDLVLLGMGEDGHTASLFPEHVHDLDELVHAVYESPKPPSERVSLSAKVLSQSQAVIFLISAKNKQAALTAWQQGENLPIATIKPHTAIEVLLAR